MSTKTRSEDQPASAAKSSKLPVEPVSTANVPHVYYTAATCPDAPHSHERPFCAICDGGLQLCTVCHGAESTLTTSCCGQDIYDVADFPDEQTKQLATLFNWDEICLTVDELVSQGLLDFASGIWFKPK